jgi:hypothetical protein
VNISASSRCKIEPDSSETVLSDLHFEKHDKPTVLTLLGIEIDGSEHFKNSSAPIDFTADGSSHSTDRRDVQYTKHESPTESTDLGMTIL